MNRKLRNRTSQAFPTAAVRGSNPVPRPLRSSKNLIERKDGRLLRRMTIYLPPATAQWLREFCVARDLELSDVTTHALLLLQRTIEQSTPP
jgi:hypothetical protein